MERRFTKDGIRALTTLGCSAVERLRIGQDFHLVGRGPAQERVYLTTLAELTAKILELAAEQKGR